MKDIPFSPDWLQSPKLHAPSPSLLPLADLPTFSGVAAGSLKVIIADDDPIFREIISTQMNAWGYVTLVTQDGREAMEALRAQTIPAIALLDWMMPGMDGIEVCQRVREAGRPVYILLLTSRGGKKQIAEGLNAGADDYLVKPFDADELQARIRVGVRILGLQATLSARVNELEALALENHQLKMQLPL